MIDEFKSARDVWKRMLTEHNARVFLRGAIWGDNWSCPHRGSLRSSALRGEAVQSGLY